MISTPPKRQNANAWKSPLAVYAFFDNCIVSEITITSSTSTVRILKVVAHILSLLVGLGSTDDVMYRLSATASNLVGRCQQLGIMEL